MCLTIGCAHRPLRAPPGVRSTSGDLMSPGARYRQPRPPPVGRHDRQKCLGCQSSVNHIGRGPRLSHADINQRLGVIDRRRGRPGQMKDRREVGEGLFYTRSARRATPRNAGIWNGTDPQRNKPNLFSTALCTIIPPCSWWWHILLPPPPGLLQYYQQVFMHISGPYHRWGLGLSRWG